MKTVVAAVLLLLSLPLGARQRTVILDTDWWTDVDDACAIRLLRTLEDRGEIKLAGVCLSALRPTSIASVSAFLRHEGYGDVPLGADLEAVDFNGRPCYHDLMTSALAPGKHICAEDCTRFYRHLLSSSPRKIDIIAVGYPNALARLLQSGPDEFSPLDGVSLVRRKVRHLWMMAGEYPEGSENNFRRTPRSRRAAVVICSLWPGRITFLGWEVGATVLSGGLLPDSDILKQALNAHGDPSGRSSWDPMTVLLAACGNAGKAGYSEVRGAVLINAETGSNSFVPSRSGKHSYVVKKYPDSYYSGIIDSGLKR